MTKKNLKTAVVAMSTSCLDYYTEPHNVRLLPLNIIVNGETFIDGQTLKADEFEDWLIANPSAPVKTSPPAENVMIRFFMKLVDEGYEEVLFITMSSMLSKTYAYVKEMLPLFADKLNIQLFDTKTGTFAEGYMALEADRCIQQGMSMEQTIARLQVLRRNNVVMFGVSDLHYLINNGRLSAFSGFLANMLSIRPIIKVTDQGQAVVNERIFSFSRTMERLVDHLGEYVHSRKNPRVYLLYTGRRRELFNQFEYMVATQLGLKNLPTYPITPVVSAHSGPNCVGFGVFWD